MRQPRYTIHISVTAKLLSPITELVENDPDCRILKLELDNGATPLPTERKRISGFAGGQRDKGISAVALFLRTLESVGRISRDAMAQAFVNHGFARTSYSPAASVLMKQKKIHMDGKYYVLGPRPADRAQE